MNPGTVSLGIYEKAIRSDSDWTTFLSQARDGGFSFVDLSVDESPERGARLTWTAQERRHVRDSAQAAGIQLGSLCLSIHRGVGPGSRDANTRAKARRIMADGIHLCHDLGIGVLQVAGYYNYHEQPWDEAERYYAEMLHEAVPLAARSGVILAIENVDGEDVTSISKAMQFVKEVRSPWLQTYPDLGNIAEQGLDPRTELAAGQGHMVALHAKDVRRGEPRRVPMGEGIVDWELSFAILAEQCWSGRLMLEMWNDDSPESVERCRVARAFLINKLADAGISVAD